MAMGKSRVVSNERTNLFNDIHFLFAGEEYCDSGYQFGPAVRPNFIIHFIVSGKGYYQFCLLEKNIVIQVINLDQQ
ncbi:hypothetical protein FMF07_02240 [Staphylococcus delphini]|nr:hypothetical protein [Staphylococcus delphini]